MRYDLLYQPVTDKKKVSKQSIWQNASEQPLGRLHMQQMFFLQLCLLVSWEYYNVHG